MSHQRFDCFGSRCGVWVTGSSGATAAADARDCLRNYHLRFSRFLPDSELSRLNHDPREVVPISATMARLIETVREAAEATGGLVDGTLLGEIEAAGYLGDLAAPLPLPLSLGLAPKRRAGRPEPSRPLVGAHPRPASRGSDPLRVRRARSRAGDRQRRARQGPVRRPDRRAAERAAQLRRRLRRRPALRRPAARGSRSPTRSAERAAARLRAARVRRGDERHRQAQLARRPTAGPPTTCSIPRPAGPPSPASSRPPRSPRPRSRPSGAPRPRC